MTDKRRLALHTVQRLAHWIEPWGKQWGHASHWSIRQSGPVVELELGTRAAEEILTSRWVTA